MDDIIYMYIYMLMIQMNSKYRSKCDTVNNGVKGPIIRLIWLGIQVTILVVKLGNIVCEDEKITSLQTGKKHHFHDRFTNYSSTANILSTQVCHSVCIMKVNQTYHIFQCACLPSLECFNFVLMGFMGQISLEFFLAKLFPGWYLGLLWHRVSMHVPFII